MKSSKDNSNKILDLSLSLKNIAKMSDDEILSKINKAEIEKKIESEFSDLYARLNYGDDFLKIFAEKPELIFEYEKIVKSLTFDFNITQITTRKFKVGDYLSVIFPENIDKSLKTKINVRIKEFKESSDWKSLIYYVEANSRYESKEKLIKYLYKKVKENLYFSHYIYHSKKSSRHDRLKIIDLYIDKNKSLSCTKKDHLLELINIKIGIDDTTSFLSPNNKIFLKSFIENETNKFLIKNYCDEIRKKALKVSVKSLTEESIFTISDVEVGSATLDYLSDDVIKSDLRYNNSFSELKNIISYETKENKKRFADIITELLLE